MDIPLTQGKIAQIDDEDWPLIAAYSWSFSVFMDRPYAATRNPAA